MEHIVGAGPIPNILASHPQAVISEYNPHITTITMATTTIIIPKTVAIIPINELIIKYIPYTKNRMN